MQVILIILMCDVIWKGIYDRMSLWCRVHYCSWYASKESVSACDCVHVMASAHQQSVARVALGRPAGLLVVAMQNRGLVDFMRHVRASVRTSEDLIVRDHLADDIIVDIESMRIATLIFALGTREDNDLCSGKDGRRMLALLSDTYEVSSRDEFIGSRIDIYSPPGRLALLDLAIIFGHGETARGLAELGVDMTSAPS